MRPRIDRPQAFESVGLSPSLSYVITQLPKIATLCLIGTAKHRAYFLIFFRNIDKVALSPLYQWKHSLS